jgi:hypothetical protein
MRIFETIVPVDQDGKLRIELSIDDIQAGKYQVVLIVEEKSIEVPLKFNSYSWNNYPPDFTFRREDIYEDDAH